ncbi:MAG TPA: amidohydrolase [Candidatus Lokiarchaeia archaeon]|nr:amidohydrolase [Candidatus Lokiarchaeia archaeon]
MSNSPIILLKNCTILTLDNEGTIADAMAIAGDTILAVGMMDQVQTKLQERGDSSPIAIIEEDLNGACIVPGFVDVHMHPGLYIYFRTQLDLSGVRSYAALARALQVEDEQRPSDEWILGVDLMEDLFTDPEERVFPTRVELDTACPNRPAVVVRHDGHICGVNSKALESMNIDATTVNGLQTRTGEIRVDANGEPTGVFTETATGYPLERVSMPGMDRLKEAGRRFSRELASFGITTVGGVFQLGAEGIAGQAGAVEIPMMEMLIKENIIDQDIVFYIVTDKPKQLKRAGNQLQKVAGEGGRFVVGGIKLYSDGSFGARTAAMFEPYADSPTSECGFMVRDKETLLDLVKEAGELGYQAIVHAIGDKANRVVVDMYKELPPGEARERRHRIEHASTLSRDTVDDIASLGIIVATQPAFINSEYTWLEKRLGPERVKQTYAFKSIIDAGAVLAGASDAPVESANVIEALQACVTRHDLVPEETITPEEALRMFTWNAAYAIRQENVKGSIEEGKLADFVILDNNPLLVPPSSIEMIKVLATYHRGSKIFP